MGIMWAMLEIVMQMKIIAIWLKNWGSQRQNLSVDFHAGPAAIIW